MTFSILRTKTISLTKLSYDMKKYLGFIAPLCLLFAVVVSSCSSDEDDMIIPNHYEPIDILAEGVDLSYAEDITIRNAIHSLQATIGSDATDIVFTSSGDYSHLAYLLVTVDGYYYDLLYPLNQYIDIPDFFPTGIDLTGSKLYEGNWGYVTCLHCGDYYEYAAHITENRTGEQRVLGFHFGDSEICRTRVYVIQEGRESHPD